MEEVKDHSIQKLLMTADTLGGVWTYAMVLSRELGCQNIEVHLATMGRKLSQEQRNAAEAIPNLRVYESSFKLEWMQDPWQDINRANQWLLELTRDIEPDLVHLNNYAHGSLSWDVPVLVTAHSDVYSWYHHVKNSAPGKEWKRYHRVVEEGLDGADQVVAITKAVKDDLDRHYSFSSEMSIIRNGLPGKDFRRRRKQHFILSLGRIWDEAKNFRLLNEAAADSIIPVVVAGENQHPENGNSNEYKNLDFTGKLGRDEVKRLLSKAAVYCLPARYEPFGYTPLEAAFSGCALLLADTPSLNEVWQDAALYFDPEDPEDLRKKGEQLFADEDLRQSLAAKAWERAQDFTAERMAGSYLNLYQYLLAKHQTNKSLEVYEH